MRDLSEFKGCPAPQPVTLQGRYVTVEPYVREQHLQALWDALGGSAEAVSALLLYFTSDDFDGIEDFDRLLTDCGTRGNWLIHVFRDRKTGKVVGMASYMRADPANGVVEVGGVAHGAAMARTPLSTEAHYLMAKHVFEDLGYRRYEWKCHNGNEPSKAAAKRYGFSYEGLFRQHVVSKRKNRDTAWFSIIDGEWPALNAAFEAWLDPANFDGAGRQIRTLESFRGGQA